MSGHAPRSLRHEYHDYIEHEIEYYKDSMGRSQILKIGDEAVASLAAQDQMSFDELLLCAEVDRLIQRRLKLPAYRTWLRKRLKLAEDYRRPERWGLCEDAPLVREIRQDANESVLVAGDRDGGAALFLAARGCQVTAIEPEESTVERILCHAGAAGLNSRLSGLVGELERFQPVSPFSAVVCSPEAFEHLTFEQRGHVIDVLKSATIDGGVHLVQTLAAGQSVRMLEQLHASYAGWQVRVEKAGSNETFLARKLVA